MAGFMGGPMGAMTSIMMVSDNYLSFIPIALVFEVVILAGVMYLVYQENGAIYIAPAWRVSQECNFRVSPYTVYVMAEEDSLQIDSQWDWEVAQLRVESNLSRNPLASEHD